MRNQVTRRKIRKGRFSTADLAADPLLTEVSIAFMQENMDEYAHTVFPIVPVDSPTGHYKVFDKGDLLRSDAKKREANDLFPEKRYGVTDATYECEEWAIETPLADEDRETEDSVVDDTAQSEILSQDLLIAREIDFWATYLTPTSGVWDNHWTGGAEFTQFDNASADILGDIDAAREEVKKACGMWPNKCVISHDVWRVIKNDADVIDRIKGGATTANPAEVNQQNFAQLIEVDQVIVGRAVYNTANEGATYSGSFFGTERLGLFYAPENPSRRRPSAGYNFSWTAFDQVDASRGLGAGIMKYRHELRAQDRFRGMMFQQFRVVASGAGLVMDDILS